jgi:hypothetical protein
MPRISKKKRIVETVKKQKSTQQQLSIEDRLAGCGRNEPEHIQYVGDVVEGVLRGEFGAILKALTAGRLSMELDHSKTSGRSSDWHLGRASMANDLWQDFEQYVLDKDRLKQPKDLTDDSETFTGLPE